MSELISVIVPVYNVEQYLDRCVQSICKQSYKSLEIILIDDGSTDQSGKICEKYSEIDSRIKVIHKKNGGLSDARNHGIEAATGQYIGFIDSDDYIEPDMYERLYKNMQAFHADISVCAYDMIYPQKSVTIADEKTITCYSTEEAFKKILYRNNIGVISCNKLFKSCLLQSIRYPLGQYFEDINTTYKLISKSKVIVYDPVVVYHYIQRNNSINDKSFKSCAFNTKLYDMEKAADEIRDFTNKHIPGALSDISIGCINYYLRIINSELDFEINNPKLIKKTKKLIKKYILFILSSNNLSLPKKIQIVLFLCSFNFYKLIINLRKLYKNLILTWRRT